LGFEQFPIEGWGKHQAWMTPESFTRMLHVGLIEPLCIARVLRRIVEDKTNPSNHIGKSALMQLRKKIIREMKDPKIQGDPINLQQVLQEYEVRYCQQFCVKLDSASF